VGVHFECLTGGVFHSSACDCGDELDACIRAIQAEGRGILVYMRGLEGRGSGLLAELQANEARAHLDSVGTEHELHLRDARTYGIGAHILVELGVKSLQLLTNDSGTGSRFGGYALRIRGTVPLSMRSRACPQSPVAIGV